jgi:hypothetical protein
MTCEFRLNYNHSPTYKPKIKEVTFTNHIYVVTSEIPVDHPPPDPPDPHRKGRPACRAWTSRAVRNLLLYQDRKGAGISVPFRWRSTWNPASRVWSPRTLPNRSSGMLYRFSKGISWLSKNKQKQGPKRQAGKILLESVKLHCLASMLDSN